MAVFSSVGLVGAWLCVILLYPLVSHGPVKGGGASLRWAAACGRFWDGGRQRCGWIALVLLLLAATAGCLKLDRKSVVTGKSVSVRVDLVGCRIIKKTQIHQSQY